ncbi:MAG: DEAD/DEAH box helicase [Bacteroidaceae bacterium]|nr:DEAD/DEAH box helicase [Bacteroidaceae bacterium]
MLPLQQAYEVKTAVLEYIKATFHFKDSSIGKAFYKFIEDEKNGLFKGPYISLKTPFVKAKDNEEIPLEIKPDFKPHKHQVDAFKRLTTQGGHHPEPTLLTTGTGSGKTECFLYPILDYVYQMNRFDRQIGVKVIIMYPMNALASDQAKRLAEAIYGTEEHHPLRGIITAGLFIGEGSDNKEYPTQMGEHNIIENRKAIVDTVPDILLTNFKMLDYGLMYQQYMRLWKGNIGEKESMLKFIVLDELHTYDGAQGTDVANLIRRLKLKLNIKEGALTPIGTSATIGNGPESKSLLCSYASDVFGETFTEDSIIEEHRVSVEDFFGDELERFIPTENQLKKLNISAYNNTADYIYNVRKTWLPGCSDNKIEIGDRLRKLQIVKDLLAVTTRGVISIMKLMTALGVENSEYQRLLRMHPEYARTIIETMLALISEAKLPDDNGTPRFPLLFLQIQLWQRELSGIQRVVQAEPEFTWRDAIPKDDRIALPIYFCRDCGASGWLTTKKDTEQKFSADASRINQAFMDNDKDVRLMTLEMTQNTPIDDYLNGELSINETYYIHPEDMTIGSKTDSGVIRVRTVRRGRYVSGNQVKLDSKCPLCMSESIAIVGGRTSTLSSVAVSQVMSSDFDTADGSKRKLLTFSNSIQDAAHLAGFYEVRTYRFLFRQSIQYYLKSVGHAVSLKELQEGFKKFWKERLAGDEYYYRFMPDELMEKIDLQENYRDPATKELTKRFKEEFDLRVDWEICSEFGFMSHLGRTLEKMGSSATFFKEDSLKVVFLHMEDWMKENNLELIAGHQDLFLRFVNGILHRLRIRGGVDHEFLRLYRTQQLKPVMLNWPRMEKVHFLHKKFGRNRLPHTMGYQPVNKGDEVLDVTTIRNNRINWYFAYFVKSLIAPTGYPFTPNPDVINAFYQQLLEVLTDCAILDKQEAAGIVNFALRPDAIYVEPAVISIKCEKCESHMYVAKSDTLTEDMHCLDFKCNDGLYNIIENSQDNYYKRVYNRETSPRIYANEHTGLLERGKRESIEKEFKEHPTPQSTNVLTATSTLEMGIDIGDLNVVANTGIPPKPSNFLQRVGRAGRKEGSALVLNYAKAGKHDMYYFTEPVSMMEGAVSTPGCFLEAKDILRRHFYAFCIDSWTSADNNNYIPNIIGVLHLGYDLLSDEQFFANRINQYIKEHQITLMEKFRKVYPESAQPVLDELFTSITDGSFAMRVINEFEHLINLMEDIKAKRKELKKLLEKIPLNDVERRRDILDQNKGLRARENAIKNEVVVEFMTNAGLLPNYAFPETGVKLVATIYSRRALGDEAENTSDPVSLELVRPATQGIKELAPGNIFYTQKLKLNIEGLNLSDRTDSLKVMRYCSDCDALAEEGTPEFSLTRCPKCGSESWNTNKHRYLRFTAATTGVYRDQAVLDDSNDDREKEMYYTMRHFRFNHIGNVTSYGLKNVAFGIEFCKDVRLTEVNYGNRKQMAEQIEVNKTKHISNLGFVTCKHCGKTASVIYGSKEGEEMHFPFCNHKDVGFPADEEHKDIFEKLYLYRTMQTEAIKVLLPVQLFDTEASTQLFKAGLELGMRHYYKSSPEHIKIDAYSEYNKATQNYDNYLVIYDTIPGGTGYLSKLYDKKEFSELLRISYEHIRDCECRREGKDGCYHCILSYGNQWQRSNLSRERAEELFKNIVDECDNWEEIDGSIGSITTSGVIEDSELEILFVKTMERLAKERNWKWEKKIDAINESYNYSLVIKDDEMEIKYNIYPQYRLGPAQGVAASTKPDFQFICTYANVYGKEIELTKIPQWSVYLDGYAYHASEANNGFMNDFTRREAIRKCSNVLRHTWTLTWSDIKPYIQPEEVPNFIDALYISKPNRDMLLDFENELWKMHDSMSRFVFMLTHPDIDIERKEAFHYLASCWTDESQYISSFEHIDDAVKENARSQYANVSDEDKENGHFYVKTTFIPQNTIVHGCAWYPYDQEKNYGDSIRYDWAIKNKAAEIEKEDWEDFWRRYNILQFFHNESVIPSVPEIVLDEVLLYFPGLEQIVTSLVQNHIPFDTEGGFELKEDDIIIAEAAIKIDGKNIVIDDFTGRDDEVELFENKGFKVYTIESFNINEIKNS